MSGQVVVLTGGVGGAKLVLGLQQVLAPERIVAVVNTGDDFRHLGLAISPDIDTLLYTLSGRANAAQGWGREGETWTFMAVLRSLGGEDWFQLGDGDLALHVARTARREAGEALSAITADVCRRWNIAVRVLPMTDDAVATVLHTAEGALEFQRYFVERRCAPEVHRIVFAGADRARPAPGVIEAILAPETEAVLIAPSNPYLSIDPILGVAPIAAALRQTSAPVVAVSPIVGGDAVKGPTAKLMRELGAPVSHAAIAAHYGDLLDGLLIDAPDPAARTALPQRTCDTLMRTDEDKRRVAQAALDFARSLR